MQPINYIPQNQPDFMRNFLTGLQAGSLYSDIQIKQQEAANAQALKEQYSKDMQEAFKLQTPEAFGQLAIKYPTQREAILAGGKLITEEQQKSAFNDASKIYNSISNGNVDYAKNLLDTKIQAFQNSGKDASGYLELKAQLEKDPKIAQASSAFIASSLDPEKFLKINKAPSEVSEAKSKADKAAIESKFAESNAVLDIQKKGWDVTKIQEDIKIAKENSRIAALNAQISREGNSLKRQEMGLKLQEMQDKRDEAIRGKTYEAETQLGQMDNLLNSVDGILNKSVIKDKSGKIIDYTSTVKSATGPISSRLPTLSSDVADLEEAVETIKSQVTMSRIGEMKGALSDKDLKTLQDSLQALSLRQSPQQLFSNLKEIQRLTTKARDNTIKRYGIPAGSPARVPDTPQSAPGQSEIDSILKKYGG